MDSTLEELKGRVAQVQDAMTALAGAWRGDWTSFDGRTLEDQLDDLNTALDNKLEFDFEVWCEANGICAPCNCWLEQCRGHKEA
jgi:hypothetical protein